MAALLFVACASCVRLGFEPWERADGGAGLDAAAGRDGSSAGDRGLGDGGVPWAEGGSATDARAPDGWVVVTAGRYTMGSPADENCRDANEDLHPVHLTRGFEIAITEVTRAQFFEVMGYDPSPFAACPVCPVAEVTWHEAAAYCNALSQAAGRPPCYQCPQSTRTCTTNYVGGQIYDCPGYRLPTEAEWEIAYRAGEDSALYNGPITNCDTSDPGADVIAWNRLNAGDRPHEVATRQPNTWGIYDMAGNAWEWCHDWYQDHLGTAEVQNPWGAASGTNRVLRGGGWGANPRRVRAAYRGFWPPDLTENYIGFRCVRSR